MSDTPTGNRRIKNRKRKNNHDFLVTGIGASAGGINALEQLFENIPSDSGIAFVVILHLSPEHESNLAAVIQRRTSLHVMQVTKPVKIEPNHVYVIPPAKNLIMVDGHIGFQEHVTKKGRLIPIDTFFRTLAGAYGVKSIGVVLSGTGTDGTLGLRHIKEAGGVSIAQEPREAQHDGMPRSAINSGMVDFTLPVAQIPERLIALRHISERIQTPPETDKPLTEADAQALREVLAILRARTGNDFSNYKLSTVLRRITRRLQVNTLEDISAYVKFLREHPAEARELLGDMIISITNFFRDSESFKVLEAEVIPKLFEYRGEGDQIRVWVTGCATGEEAYSLAILLLEHAQRLEHAPSIQVFATDIDQDSLNEARDGFFPESISADVSPERLRRFFNKEESFYRVKKEVRETVLFAPHNILRDPPFSKLDMVSCRNLLIYLNRETQQRVLEIFHFSLRPEGYLFLGSSESADNLPELFTAVDKKHRVFRRRGVASATTFIPSMPVAGKWEVKAPNIVMPSRKTLSFGELHHKVLEHYAPPSVLVNSDYDIVHLSENAGRFLHFTGGEPSRNLIKVVQPDLRLDLRAALHEAVQGNKDSETRRVRTKIDGELRPVNIIVRPIDQPATAQGFLLVIFEEGDAVEIPAPAKDEKGAGDVGQEMEPIVRQLEDELQRTKDQLRSTVEQYETSTEELRASNEELQAINEELRSASEELETGKEELQSLNEELSTVNYELKEKVDEVSQSHSDLQNLFSATDIWTIFLDREMRLKRYTPNVQKIFNVIPSDLGRPLTHITHKLEYTNLLDDARSVLSSLIRIEREVRSTEGDWYIARLVPYRTVEDKIDGIVLTLVDITQRKLAEAERERLNEDLMKERALMDAVVRQMPAGVIIAEADSGNIVFTNEQAELIWQATAEKSDGKHFSSYPGYHEDGRPYAPEEFPMSRAIKHGEVVRNEEIKMKRDNGGWGFINISSSPIRDPNGNIIAGVATFYDTTEQKRAESNLQYSEERLRLLVESIEDYAIFVVGRSGRIETWNTGAENIFGYSESEALGQPGEIIFTPEDRANGVPEQEMSKALTEGRADDERWHIRKDGSRFFASGVMSAMRGADSAGCVKILRDLTDRKQMEEELRRSRDELEARVRERTREIEESYRALEAEVVERRAAEEQVKELLRRVVETQELERRRIARDLHDHLGQQMTALRLSLESLKEQSKGHSALHTQIRQLQAAANQIDKDVDFLAWELRPGTLDLLGLAATLESFVEEWSKHFTIPAEFHTIGIINTRLSVESEINLYRIAQEALNNIYKHAQANRVAVMLEKRDNNVVLIIEDDGKGFDPNDTSGVSEGVGLLGMRERASLSGGTLEIQSEPGAGTTIFVRLPAHLPEKKA